jgi:hypothetical protein
MTLWHERIDTISRPVGNVRPARAYGGRTAGFYGQSLYGRWPGDYVITTPCAPVWRDRDDCAPAQPSKAP